MDVKNNTASFRPAQAPLNEERGVAASVGRWIHRHKDSVDKPVGFMGYQIIRNMLAAIPYGIATAFVWDGFEKLTKSAVGIDAANPKMPGMAKFLRSPVRDIAMIGAGFTLYRGTLKLVRYVKESLFDKQDSEAQTIHEVRNLGSTIIKDLKEIAPAEINSTPYGAIALGMGRRFVGALEGYGARPPENMIEPGKHPRTVHFNADGIGLSFTTPKGERGLKPWFSDFKNRVLSRKSMPYAEALTFIGSFLAFFELSDRLYKDVQVRRGVWEGEDNALARKVPPKNPDQNAPASTHVQTDIDKHRGQHPEVFGGDPNIKGFLFSRIIPTFLGIGAYTFTKRAAYHTMGHFAAKPSFWKRAFVEGAATSTFFVMTSVGDAFEVLNKKLFDKSKADPVQPMHLASMVKEDASMDALALPQTRDTHVATVATSISHDGRLAAQPAAEIQPAFSA